LGLVPQLHRAFFRPYDQGGIFNAWLTSSIKNIGKFFTSLQVFLVGCKLGVSFRENETKQGLWEGSCQSGPHSLSYSSGYLAGVSSLIFVMVTFHPDHQ
jgi:hypothetical protein